MSDSWSPASGSTRPTASIAYSFGLQTLSDGIEYVAVMIGAYGLGEVLTRLESGAAAERPAGAGSTPTVLPTLADAIRLRGRSCSTAIGILVGVVPGAGATVASFVAYGAQASTVAPH